MLLSLASEQAREVGVKVSSQYGEHLGWTRFCYVDEMREMVRQLLRDEEKLSSFVAMWLQECHLLGLDQGKGLVFIACVINDNYSVFNPRVLVNLAVNSIVFEQLLHSSIRKNPVLLNSAE